MQINVKISKKVTARNSLELTGDDILNLLRTAHHDIPATASITFEVPGGGDWSNTSIDIDQDSPIFVRWETTTNEDDQ